MVKYAPWNRPAIGRAEPIGQSQFLVTIVAAEAVLSGKTEGDRLLLSAAGPWIADHARSLETLVENESKKNRVVKRVEIDLSKIDQLDTFGAWLVERLVRNWTENGAQTKVTGVADDFRELVEDMHKVKVQEVAQVEGRPPPIGDSVAAIGHAVSEIAHYGLAFFRMLGATITAFGRVIAHPMNFRLTSMVHHLESVGWRAVPIVLLITFLVGCIVAQQGIFQFRKFGADVFVVDMVGVLVLRELGVLIVCIMIAGRSGSAYTAELGSMKMREEIDALRTMGFDPVEVLILPRILALVIAVPILTFLGSMSALYGGGLTAWLYGGIDPDIFLSRLREAISLDHFKVGMMKAPFMALVIGTVACVQGLEVKGSAESLGQQTTASVVESIFLVIVLDGIFAIFFAAIGM
jgi:phospholipid/cholesterol/gamma-HCH transport system permease protein